MLGTERIDTSETWNIVGIPIIAKTKLAENMDHPKFKNMTKKDNPNKPYTIEGIEANISAPKRIILVNFPSFAYSTI